MVSLADAREYAHAKPYNRNDVFDAHHRASVEAAIRH